MTSSGLVHSLHSPKGHCANCAVEMPGSHDRALCSNCADCADDAARQRQMQAVRRSLAKIDPGLLAMADACKSTFNAKLEGVQGDLDGQRVGAGKFGPQSELWAHWPEAQK